MRKVESCVGTEVQHSQRLEQQKFRPDIEGLRAIAVVAVVLFHAQVPGIGGGFVGVDVFFVISGFLITGKLWSEVSNTGTATLLRFYGARARRLLPAAAFVGVATLVASVVLLPGGQARNVIGEGIASSLYVGNLWLIIEDVDYFAAGGHQPPSPFQHYWSLGVEEQFYLLWAPVILGAAWLISRIHRRRNGAMGAGHQQRRPLVVLLALIAALSFGLSLTITFVWPAIAFFSLPTRAWQFAVGGLLALTVTEWRSLSPRVASATGWVGMAAIVVACTWLSEATLYPGFAALLPTLGTAMVIGAGCADPSQGCGRVLGLPPMRAIGRISYSWYLWHWPVLIFAPILVGHPLGLAGRLVAALFAAGLAVLTLRFVENPLRFAASIRNSAWRSLGVGAAVTAVAVAVGVGLLAVVPIPVGRGAPVPALALTAAQIPAGASVDAYDTAVQQAFAQVQAAVAESANIRAVPSNLQPSLMDAQNQTTEMGFGGCVAAFFEAGQRQCVMGDAASPTTVALFGDSHAAMLIPAFQQIAEQRHWRLDVLSKAGCPPLDLHIANPVARLLERVQHCAQWRAQSLERLRAEHPKLVVVSFWRQYSSGNWRTGFTPYDAAWLDSMTRLVAELRSTGAKVLVLGPIPDPHSTVPDCLSSHLDDATACAPTTSTANNQIGIAAEAAATAAGGGQYASLTDLFCTAERCPVIVGNSLVYADWSHLTFEHSRLLAPVLGALADRWLGHS